MRVLVIGGGGREHALCWALRRSLRVSDVVCAPGNAGIAAIAECVPVEQTSIFDMLRVVHAVAPSVVVVGPEVPLAAGIVDALQGEGVRVFGPTQAAARLEGSKSFSKAFMQRHGIATARYKACASLEEVDAALPGFNLPVVVKADGLAAGKGVVIAETHAGAASAARELMDLGGTLVLEEFLVGEELSFFALCDGKNAVAIAAAQDHKRLLEGDLGPNTGGMGAYSTDALLPDGLHEQLLRDVAQKTVDGMRDEGVPFQGILFCGMMLTADGPKVLEFNTRWGDPEMQAILLRMETDVMDLIDASIDGTAAELKIAMKPGASACVIAASAGYPAGAEKGGFLHGLDAALPAATVIFHSGTALQGDDVVTGGGRVLGVASVAASLPEALQAAYAALGNIHFEGMQFRRDIGHRA